MRVAGLVILCMIAFAANSVLNRMALAQTDISSVDFAMIRVCFGALTLFMVLALRGGLKTGRFSWASSLGLLAYMIGFSVAYQALEAGLGALLLFGVVQVAMFGGAVLLGERPKAVTYLGAFIGLVGLGFVLWPQEGNVQFPLIETLAMIVAGVGWAAFSLAGRGARFPLATTFRAFLVCVPATVIFALWQGIGPLDPMGVALAALSGAVTSGLGYTIWYHVLPMIKATSAALAQLTVPLIAMAGGMVLLGESLTMRFVIGAILVLTGVLLPIWWQGQRGADGKESRN